jgi:hypothetical protein
MSKPIDTLVIPSIISVLGHYTLEELQILKMLEAMGRVSFAFAL